MEDVRSTGHLSASPAAYPYASPTSHPPAEPSLGYGAFTDPPDRFLSCSALHDTDPHAAEDDRRSRYQPEDSSRYSYGLPQPSISPLYIPSPTYAPSSLGPTNPSSDYPSSDSVYTNSYPADRSSVTVLGPSYVTQTPSYPGYSNYSRPVGNTSGSYPAQAVPRYLGSSPTAALNTRRGELDYQSSGRRDQTMKTKQSDDEFQRHEAERRRREGRAQDRFGQRTAPGGQDSRLPDGVYLVSRATSSKSRRSDGNLYASDRRLGSGGRGH